MWQARSGFQPVFVPVCQSRYKPEGRTIDGGVVKAPGLYARFVDECQELDIHRDLMPADLLVVTLRPDFAPSGAIGQPVHAIALEDAVNDCIRVSGPMPDDPDRPEMVFLAQRQNLLGYRLGRLVRVAVRNRSSVR